MMLGGRVGGGRRNEVPQLLRVISGVYCPLPHTHPPTTCSYHSAEEGVPPVYVDTG